MCSCKGQKKTRLLHGVRPYVRNKWDSETRGELQELEILKGAESSTRRRGPLSFDGLRRVYITVVYELFPNFIQFF